MYFCFLKTNMKVKNGSRNRKYLKIAKNDEENRFSRYISLNIDCREKSFLQKLKVLSNNWRSLIKKLLTNEVNDINDVKRGVYLQNFTWVCDFPHEARSTLPTCLSYFVRSHTAITCFLVFFLFAFYVFYTYFCTFLQLISTCLSLTFCSKVCHYL